MVTKAVNMDLKVNAGNAAKRADKDSGFSDVLGNVSSDSSRRNQGLSNPGRKNLNRDFHKEFGYTRKASESVHTSEPSRMPVSKDSSLTADKGRMSGEIRDALNEAADEVLSDAVVTVVKTVADKGETPSAQETADMLSDALRSMVTGENAAEEAPEIAAETLIPGEAADVPEMKEAVPVKAEDDGASEKDAAADLLPMTRDELIVALADAVVNAGNITGEKNADGDGPEMDEKPGDSTVHVITPDSSFLMTEKHAEAAMLTGADLPVRMNIRTSEGGEAFRAELNALMSDGGEEEFPYDDLAPADALYDEGFAAIFTGRTDVHRTSNDIFTDRSTLIEKILAKLDNETTEDGEPIIELEVVKDTAKMLGEMIGKAKKELGLTETRYERVEDEGLQTVQLMQDEPTKLSRSMMRSDRTDELDHILRNGSSADGEEDDAPKTQTYDAVHMNGALMNDRTQTDIPLEKLQERAANTEVRPPEIQTAEQILERIGTMRDDHMEFTMVLNPESLGKITVRLVMAGERTAVEINAENPETRAILASRSESLQSMLRDNGVELESYQVVSEQEDAQFMHQSYDGSSKNPYSRNDGGEEKENEDGEEKENFDELLKQM